MMRGVELLSLWVKKYNLNYVTVITGPAIKIFEKNSVRQKPLSLDEAIEICDWVFCSTSWQSEIEKKAIKKARDIGKKTISFLDHWVNYKERYFFRGNLNLPDEIWVSDKYSKSLIIKEFPHANIKQVENPYFEYISHQIKLIETKKVFKKSNSGKNILFLAENFIDHSLVSKGNKLFCKYNENDAINFFMKNIHFLNEKIKDIKIRPHPSDKENKYNWAMKKYPKIKYIDSDKTLIEDISNVDIVVGCTTMGLAVLVLQRKSFFMHSTWWRRMSYSIQRNNRYKKNN